MPDPQVKPAARPRRVPRFKERAQAMLDAYSWPKGVDVVVDPWSPRGDDVYIGGARPGDTRPHPVLDKTMVKLDPYTLDSAKPERVIAEAVRLLRNQSRDPRFTSESRAGAAAFADRLEAHQPGGDHA
jgi:hypothetical protein